MNVRRLNGMVRKPGSPVSLKETDGAIASEAARNLGTRRPRPPAPHRKGGRRSP